MPQIATIRTSVVVTGVALIVLLAVLARPASAKLVAPTASERQAICLGQRACDTAGGDYEVRIYVSTRTDRRWALIEHLVAKPGLMGTYLVAVRKVGARWRDAEVAGTAATDPICDGRDLPTAFRRDLTARPYC